MRTKQYTLTGIDASAAGIAALQAPASAADTDGLALSQAIDVTADIDNIATAQTYASGVGLTLQALAASLIPPRQISLTSVADLSATTFTIVGLNHMGTSATQLLAGPNNNTVSFTAFYSSVTSITPNATDAVNTVSAGYLSNSIPMQLTLNGALGNGIGVPSDTFGPVRVSLTSTDNLSGRTFAISGLGSNGLAQSETVTGPNNTTVFTTNTYTRVDSIAPDDDASGTLSAGIDGAFTGLTLVGGSDALATPRFVTFTSTADLSAIDFTIVGVDRWGNPMTEVVVGPNNDTVSSKGAYTGVTSITPSATSASQVSVGWPAGAVTPWVLNGHTSGHDGPPLALLSFLATVGAPTGNAEETYSMFSQFSEPDIDIDDRQAMAPGPSTTSPMEARGRGARFVLTSGAGTAGTFKITRMGRN